MITGNAIANQLLVITSAKVSMPNTATNLDKDYNHNQDPLQSLRHDHGHYIHHDDTWGQKRTQSPITLSCLRLEHRTSPPWAKSPSVLHQTLIVELKTRALVHQDDKPVTKNVVNIKMQRALFACYPTPPPSPDHYYGENSNDLDSKDCQPPPLATMLKWYHSDKDSYSSCCPKDKNILASASQQSNWRENSFRNSILTQDTCHIRQWLKFK